MTTPLLRRRRHGGVLVVALVSLSVLAVLQGLLLRSVTQQRRLGRLQERRQQAVWLAEAGVERAAAKLRLDADYAGESWRIAAKEIGGRDAALVKIEIQPADRPTQRIVRVRAFCPPDLPHRVQWEKSVRVNLPPAGDD